MVTHCVGISRPDVPFLLGTWGAKTIRACIRHVSEIKIGGTANPNLIPHFCRTIADATARVDRNPGEITLVAGAATVVAADGKAAREVARRKVAPYMSVVAGLDPALEIDRELLTRTSVAAANHDISQAARDISDSLLSRFARVGTPEEVTERAHELFEAGAAALSRLGRRKGSGIQKDIVLAVCSSPHSGSRHRAERISR